MKDGPSRGHKRGGTRTMGSGLALQHYPFASGSNVVGCVNAKFKIKGARLDLFPYRFVYDEAGRLVGEYDKNNGLRQETVWLDDIPVAVLKKDAEGQIQSFAIHTDHLNTPRAILDSQKRVVWKWNSNAFGQGLPLQDPDRDGVVYEYNLRFPGQYYDRETGLHYNYFRDYDPTTGRYVQSDPIGLAGGLNLYAYVDGNPITGFDPLGLANSGKWPRSKPRNGPVQKVIDILRYRANDMQQKNFIDGDKFYHCLAMCESASLGPIEASIAATAGIARELNQQYRRGEPADECAKDNAANGQGIAAGLRRQNCVLSCSGLMPAGMTYP